MPTNIVVVGAGVTGLTTALLLSRDKGIAVTIVAKHMPGDYDIEYASPFAGANVLPMLDEANSRWERRTWPELVRICKEIPEAGIHFQKVMGYRRDQDMRPADAGIPMDPLFDRDPWYKNVMPGYQEFSKDKVIPGFDSAFGFQSLCINTAVYLMWLVGQCLKNGVVLKRAVLSDINEAKSMSHTGAPADIIVNATGLGSLKLGGVLDTKMAPSRGQTVLVRNECTPMTVSSGTEDGGADIFYVMQRAAGGGTILGGTYDIGNWESNPDPNIANRIMKRAVTICPQLTNGKGVEALSVIRHAVGLRPYRTGGVRIEREQLADGTHVVHNYGHAGWGYQGSYGTAERAIELVNEIRKARGEDVPQTKLFAWDDGKNPAYSKRTSKM